MSLRKITLISTSIKTGYAMSELFSKELGEVIVHNIIDDSLVKEILAQGDVISPEITKRVCWYVISAEISGANLVVITCSSISSIAKILRCMVKIPVIRIDEPMAELATEKGDRIKVLATLPSTLTPSIQLLREKYHQRGKKGIVDGALIKGARRFLEKGERDQHDQLIKKEIKNALKKYDIVVLAQASMESVVKKLSFEEQQRVLASPRLAIKYIKRKFFSPTSQAQGV